MKLATPNEVREMDRRAASEFNIKETMLMENAGCEIARKADEMAGKGTVLIISGGGNNGGDGFVAARHLLAKGRKVEVVFVGAREKLKEAARENYFILKNLAVEILEKPLKEYGEKDFNFLKEKIEKCALLVDAVVGTGLKLPLRAEYKKLFSLINESSPQTLSVDVPSGIDAYSGAVDEIAVKAKATVTFALAKTGLYFFPAAEYAGKITVCHIGMAANLLQDENIKQNLIDNNMVKALLGKRRADLHKGNCGKVLAIAGSLGMTGAAFLCAEAALRSGAGLVTLAAPKSQQQILAVKLTEAMTQPLPDADGHLAADAVKKMLALSENADVVLIGSGLGRAEETMQAVRQFLLATDKKVVIDADAIFAIKDNAAILRKMKKMPVLTPHIGEMSFLTKERREFIAANMQDAATKTARELNAIIALKSARTVVAYPDGAVYINNKGNAGMATGGSGDVLAGTVAGFLAQYPSEEKIAAAAVYVHAVAGDFAAEGGMEGLIAGDILRALPKARAHIEADDL